MPGRHAHLDEPIGYEKLSAMMAEAGVDQGPQDGEPVGDLRQAREELAEVEAGHAGRDGLIGAAILAGGSRLGSAGAPTSPLGAKGGDRMAHVEPLRDEDPPRSVQVRLDDAHCVEGWLELLWDMDGACWALVRYTTLSGHTEMGWFHETRIHRPGLE